MKQNNLLIIGNETSLLDLNRVYFFLLNKPTPDLKRAQNVGFVLIKRICDFFNIIFWLQINLLYCSLDSPKTKYIISFLIGIVFILHIPYSNEALCNIPLSADFNTQGLVTAGGLCLLSCSFGAEIEITGYKFIYSTWYNHEIHKTHLLVTLSAQTPTANPSVQCKKIKNTIDWTAQNYNYNSLNYNYH